MPIPIAAIAGGMQLAGGLASLFGGNQQRRDLNNLINYAHGAGNNVLNFINGNTLAPGQASSGYFSTFDPLFGYANSIVNPATGDFFNQGMANMFGQIQGYGNNILPGLMSPQNPMMDPMMQQLLPWYDQMAGNANYGMDSAFNNLNSFGWNPGGQGIYDYAMNNAQNNPYNQGMMDIGSWYMQNGGSTPYNTGVLDQSLYGIRQGGYTPQIQGNLDFFGQNARNPYTQSIMQGQQMGQNTMGQGSGLINSAMGGMQQQFGMDPEAFLGQRGRGVLDSLAASPYIGGSYNTVQNLLGQGTANYGMTPYGQANWQQAMPRAYGSVDQSNAQMNDAWGLAMGRAGGNQDALPSWFGEFLQNAPGLFGNAGGGSGLAQISAGGGGGGASAGAMSRDLGPVDPTVQAALQQALDIFNKDPLLPMNQVVSMARDSAATAAKNQADAIARKAANLGGQGAIGAGVRNQAYADFADQALEGEATAIREAMLGQQGLQLNRAGQSAALAQAMQAAKSQREGLFGQMNIADAGNQTQASIANSNSADAAAARSLQAQIANASNSLGAAQLQASIYNNLLNNATGLRGQNVEQQIAALNTLPGMQNAMTQRQGLLFDQMNQAGNQANQRYLGTLGITGQLNDIANTDINRWNTMLQPLVAGQNTGTARGGQYGNLAGVGANLIGTGAGLYGNMENNASQNYGTSANAISNLINSANNNLGQYANLFGLGDTSQMNRLNFGGNMTNAGIGNTLNFANLANNANNSSLNFGISSGQLGNSLLNTQGNIWNNAMNNYLGVGGLNNATSANTANIFGQYAGMMNNAWSPIQAGVNNATGVMSGLNNGLLQYMGGAMSLMPSYMQGATFNPYGNNGQGPPNFMSGLGGFLQQNAQGIGQGIGGLFNRPSQTTPSLGGAVPLIFG